MTDDENGPSPLHKNPTHTKKNQTESIYTKTAKFVYIMASSVISINGYKYSDERASFTLVDFI